VAEEGVAAVGASVARASATGAGVEWALVAADEAAPAAGTAPPVGATTSLAVGTLPVREPPPGNVEAEGVEEPAVEAAPAAGAAPPLGATTSLAVATLPVREPPPGNVESEGVEEIRAARSLTAAAAAVFLKNWRSLLTSG
jgi:hypothetical protein